MKLLTRAEAERQGLLDSDAWREACEVRWVRRIVNKEAYYRIVEVKRGKPAADRLRSLVEGK